MITPLFHSITELKTVMALTMFYNIIKVVYSVQYAKIGYAEIALEF